MAKKVNGMRQFFGSEMRIGLVIVALLAAACEAHNVSELAQLG